MGYEQKSFHDWTVQDVQAWLDAIGLPALKPQFNVNAVTGEDLLELTTDDLCTHIGATPLQARKIQNEVGKLTGTRTTSMSSAPSQAYSGAVAQAAAVQPTSPVAHSATSPYAMQMDQGYKKESYDVENSPQPPPAMVGYPSGPPAAYPSGAYPPAAYPPGAYPAPQIQTSGLNTHTSQNVNVVVGANQSQVGSCGGFQMTMFILGWFLCIPWYIGALGRFCTKFNPTVDMCPWIANIVMSVISIGIWIALGVVLSQGGGYTYYYYG